MCHNHRHVVYCLRVPTAGEMILARLVAGWGYVTSMESLVTALATRYLGCCGYGFTLANTQVLFAMLSNYLLLASRIIVSRALLFSIPS
jgi:hypothetical protein